MRITRLSPADAAAYQSLRLDGLRESPTSFGSSYEEEVARSIDVFAASLATTSGRTFFGAFAEEELIGVVSVGAEESQKERHRGFIRGMYVRPAARRQGVGRALLAEAIRHARAIPGLRQLTLTVTAGNAAAIATYERFGFVAYGTAPEALYVDGRYYDELYMVCHLVPREPNAEG
jgi:RimJ/RimL family protein N-acetyltransferase